MKKLLFAILAVALCMHLVFAMTDDEKAQAVLVNASAALGWPDTITMGDNNASFGNEYYISSDGQGSSSDLQASILVLPSEALSGFWLDFASQQADYTRSSYQGRDAAISTYGQDCNPKPLVKFFNDMFNGIFESIFGPSNDTNSECVTDHGAILWACGNYLMIAQDQRSDQGGEENDIAAALYNSAESAGLCSYGNSLVLMADTPDLSGSKKISDAIQMGQKVNQYYGINSYGQQPPFSFTFKDADGSAGSNDWYHITSTMSSMASDPDRFHTYGEQAIQAAFKGADVPQDLYFERIVVVYPGPPQQLNASSPLYDCDSWENDAYSVQVDAMQGKRNIYVKNIIYLSEKSQLGAWAHEFGHSLPSKYTLPAPQNFARIGDRYNYVGKPYGQYGELYDWSLMGYGMWWPGDATAPVQMDGFTKQAAGWLDYSKASLNQTYTLTAVEDMKKGDTVLTLDNPESRDPNDYYIIEAHDSSAAYGAPESGVTIYSVSGQGGHAVVNLVPSQVIPNKATNAQGLRYYKPTLYSSSATYESDAGEFQIKLLSDTGSSAQVEIDDLRPANVTGVILNTTESAMPANPNDIPDVISPPKDEFAAKPGIDLHAYDSAGNHVGMNYQTGDYEVNIPGADASGEMNGGEQWIFVPAGTQVTYVVSTNSTQEFLANNPAYSSSVKPLDYSAEAVKYDASGNRYVADLGNGSADTGATIDLKSPDDPSLSYQQQALPGVGNNSACAIGPGFLVLLVIGVITKRRMT